MNEQTNEAGDSLRTASSRPLNGPIRRRAIVACRHCSFRKVRCDVSTSGIPCSNCTRDHTICKVVPRKKRRGRQTTTIPSAIASTVVCHESSPPQGYRYDASAVETISQFVQQTPVASSEAEPYSSIEESAQAAALVGSPSDHGENLSAYTQAIDRNSHPPRDTSSGLFYFGGRQGLGGFMFDICEGPATPRNTHYLLPLSKKNTITPEEEAYLNSIGAFNLPRKEICNTLLRCYLRNVHQLLPVLDIQGFLNDYIQYGAEKMSLILLWSMFFASSNFADSDVLETAGFRTRKAMKRAFYRRAKALYDCDYEKDKITLIQSVILISLWYNDTDDRHGAWHWIGVAISLSQSIGLHRRLRFAVPSHPIPTQREKVYRRIWWTCLVRDRWLSLAKGQPMRIHAAECDVTMPSVSDITDEIEIMDPEMRGEYIPWEPNALAVLWIRLVRISKALGSILELHDKLNGLRPAVHDIQECEEEIALSSNESAGLEYIDPLLRLFASQLQLLHEATIVVLFRPYIFKGPSDPNAAVTNLWQQKSLDKARSAAANTTRILEGLLEGDVVKYLKSMTITALIPAMQIHLLDCKSTKPLVRQFATQKLHICMLVMSELRRTYWGADFVFEMFQRAESKILEKPASPSEGPKIPEMVSIQNEMPLVPAPVMPMPNNESNPWFSRQMSLDEASRDISNSFGVADTECSTYGSDFDDPFQFLLNSTDFSEVFLTMV